MRDVSEPSGPGFKSTVQYILRFLKNPIQEMAHLPNWSWKTLLWVQILCAVSSGFLAGLTKPVFFSILAGVIVTPFIATLLASVLTAFLYYYFQVFEKRTVPAIRIFTIAVFASIPFFIFLIGSTLLPPATLIGFAFSSMLLAVGMTENLQMQKRRAIRLAIILFAVVFLIWALNKISVARFDRASTQQALPVE